MKPRLYREEVAFIDCEAAGVRPRFRNLADNLNRRLVGT